MASLLELDSNDCYLVNNVLKGELIITAFDLLKNEVAWQAMNHRGNEVPRLVAVQGQVEEDGSFPIYRHPADNSPPCLPFTPTVLYIKREVEKVLTHSLNHVLIQMYRDGNDAISEHSDKTIDVVKDSKIVNVSLGAQRTMVLRPKKSTAQSAAKAAGEPTPDFGSPNYRRPIRIPLPHNSMVNTSNVHSDMNLNVNSKFILGLKTNRYWLHAINRDKRPDVEKSEAELSPDTEGVRISLTFRCIGTFCTADEKHIWGQGATGKRREDAKPTTPKSPEYREDRINLIRAFSKENQECNLDWDVIYGAGSDVLHLEGVE
ncbi:uncharacterized protein EI90DRAFT_3122133 [Cantharellus anzutake]|uniref:uncharacterized protein n=1 Tax=Cantharellus anzutake TaxID=1750568 RepID=UPI001904D400|nr:uncharacterized protein EI90DRAFT_3122133 [Cantharellus anzutake]KAF8333082.1 hypothetical protein EI90DRAFT_3122133 [Cantharellus anzutake]